MDDRVSVIVDAGTRIDEYTLTAANAWRVSSTVASQPPLLHPLAGLANSPQLDMGSHVIPSNLGLVPAYATTQPINIRVIYQSRTDQAASTAAGRKMSLSGVPRTTVSRWAMGSEVETASLTMHPMHRTTSRFFAQWSCPVDSLLDADSHVSLTVSSSHTSNSLGATENKRAFTCSLDLFFLRVVPSVAAKQNISTPSTPLSATFLPSPPLSNSQPALQTLAASSHVFYEMLRHRDYRLSQAEDAEEHVPDARHPLFGRWVAEDSPAFRAAISMMEDQALGSRARYKDLVRQSSGLRDAYQTFMRQLSDALDMVSDLPAFKPMLGAFIIPLKQDINQLLNTVCTNWDLVVVAHARRLYEASFRHLEERRNEFETASDHYYSELGKHLKAKASREDEKRDEAFARCKWGFETARWSYFLDMWNATHGWSELEMFIALLKWAKSVMRSYESSIVPTLKDNSEGQLVRWFLDNIPATYEEIRLQKSEVTEFKALLDNPAGEVVREHCLTPTEGSNDSEYVRLSLDNPLENPVQLELPAEVKDRRRINALRLSAVQSPDQVSQMFSHLPPMPRSSSVTAQPSAPKKSFDRPLSLFPDSVRDGVREGFLFARSSSKHVTTNRNMIATNTVWRRYWCAVRNGRFYRYTSGKSHALELRSEPLALSTATVRVVGPESKQAGKRRFCFELITPAYYGVYQATSDHDLQTWVGVLRRAIELSLLHYQNNESTASFASRPSDAQPSTSDLRTSVSCAGSMATLSIGGRDSQDTQAPDRLSGLLPQLQQYSANKVCADCGATAPDWCSLNLACLLCIECSGIHRSLGTHISKVRSLTLDTSFTPVAIAMMLATGNALNREVFGAVSRDMGPESPRAVRQQFIEAKYVARLFVDRMWTPKGRLRELYVGLAGPTGSDAGWDEQRATWLLFAAVEIGDISNTARAVALGANVNGQLKCSSVSITPLFTALFGQHHAAQLLEDTAEPDNARDAVDDFFEARLEIAEFLILNGASINWQDSTHGYSALHLSCVTGDPTVAKYLVDKGANLLLTTRSGARPLDLLSAQHAARVAVDAATRKAEERARQEAARSPVNTQGPIEAQRPQARRGSLVHDGLAQGNPVITAARRFTQSLNPSAAMTVRMSISTERPSVMEIGTVSSTMQGHGGGWLASLGGNKPKRLTGIREQSRVGSKDHSRLDAMLPTIMSAREEDPDTPIVPMMQLTNQSEPSTVLKESSDSVDTSKASSRVSVDKQSAAVLRAAIPMPPIPDDHIRLKRPKEMALVSRHSSVRSAKSSLTPDPITPGTVSLVSSPTKPYESSSGNSSFVDLNGNVSVGPAGLKSMRPATGNRTSLALFAFREESRKHRQKDALVRRNTKNALRTSSSADGIKQMAESEAQGKSKFRLIPRSSRMAFNGLFGRSSDRRSKD